MKPMKFLNLLFVAAAFARSNLPSRWMERHGSAYRNHIPRHHRNRSKYKPHQGEREKLRRRVGGFAQFRLTESTKGAD